MLINKKICYQSSNKWIEVASSSNLFHRICIKKKKKNIPRKNQAAQIGSLGKSYLPPHHVVFCPPCIGFGFYGE
ncbi:hypothetical protein HanIR_Chr03g0100581 [Helianthus annuus]|nr:hypothetical protein HanIR_Chr03g0100581 [Helianthus annuus]